MNWRNLSTEGLRRVLHRAGFDLVRTLGEGHLLKQAARVMEDRHVGVVLDVGANTGQWARAIRALGYHGRIVSCEPLSDAYRTLEAAARGDDLWTVINVALGEEPGETVIHVADNSQSSSILEMLPAHREADPRSGYIRDQPVRVATLDAAVLETCAGMEPIFLKIDAQGYEDRILNGADTTLKSVVGMQIELSLVALYEGEPLIEEMIASVRSLGFVPTSLEPNFRSKETSRLLQVDGLFVRD
ncbi:MAG: FkbM family methyltransferase [Actinobacteria bacterium]|nr:FkbM family methyltransferase [Actinomycetota bacterium]